MKPLDRENIVMNIFNSRKTMELIGKCCVDSGQLLITDPCYATGFINNAIKDTNTQDYSYSGCCNATSKKSGAGQLVKKTYRLGTRNEVSKKSNQTFNAGVATSTGHGDGEYPVYALYDGNRVASIIIRFPEPMLDMDTGRIVYGL